MSSQTNQSSNVIEKIQSFRKSQETKSREILDSMAKVRQENAELKEQCREKAQMMAQMESKLKTMQQIYE